MNKSKLRAKMTEFGDTSESLAQALGISHKSFSRSIYTISWKRRPFTEFEIAIMKQRWNLTPWELVEIFFDDDQKENSK